MLQSDGAWKVRGFIDIDCNAYTISSDTKIVSKVLELCIFPLIMKFATSIGYRIELAKKQNYYPDLTFVNLTDPSIMFAVDLKTTYRLPDNPEVCNGFTLGSHGAYFTNRNSTKNIQHPYAEYSGHFCLGIIYTRHESQLEETLMYHLDQLDQIPAVASDFLVFAQEKWKIASDKGGSGNTANIGSIKNIPDIIEGRGVFTDYGEDYFDGYWMNYGHMQIPDSNGNPRPLKSFKEYLEYRNLYEGNGEAEER